MTRRADELPGHKAVIGRRDAGARHHGGYHRYYTTLCCSCGWNSRDIEIAPTRGGWAKAVIAHRHHVEDVISRDALQTVMRAHTEWRSWQPGDGSCYRVRLHNILGGPDHGDRVLLVSINRRTWAFQFPTVEYRRQEMGAPAQRRRALSGQVTGDWFGRAVAPLLEAEGIIDALEA